MSENANHRIRKCNSNCHNATHEKCVCWCGGLFHGKNGAENRARMGEMVKERFPDATLDSDGCYYMSNGPIQLKFF